MKTMFPILTAALFGFALSSCEDSSSEADASDPKLESLFVETDPGEAKSVIEARKDPTPGSEITLVGRVGGTLKPFTEEYALFVLADNTLETCDRIPDDECPTPWDACCADPEVIKNSRLTVQVLGEDARPIEQSLKGVKGLKELDEVVVTGTIAATSTPENLIVNATSIYQKPLMPVTIAE
ncbi:MAG: hypothetical protein AAGH89_13500 [Verrucomicrobiota bacterium]